MPTTVQTTSFGPPSLPSASTQDFLASLLPRRNESAASKDSRRCPFAPCTEVCADQDAYDYHTTTCPHAHLLRRSPVATYLRIVAWAEGANNGGKYSSQRLADFVQHHIYQSLVDDAAAWNADSGRTSDGMIVHRVELDDTLSGLAVRYGVTTQSIKQANRLGFGGNLYVT